MSRDTPLPPEIRHLRRDLRRGLIEAIALRLSTDGFKFWAATSSFIRRSNDKTDWFVLTFLDPYDHPGWEIELGMGLRIECVEDIFHRTSRWNPKAQAETLTIGGSIGKIFPGDSHAYNFFIDSSVDIPHVAAAIIDVFQERALPYFAKYCSLQEIDRELNSFPAQATPHRVMTWLRCSTGLIVAKLVDRPDYEQLVDIYTSTLRRKDRGFYLSRFEDLVRSLETVHTEFGSADEARSSGQSTV